jgi:hypothetical protein
MKMHRILVLNLVFMFLIAFAQNTFARAPKEPLYIDLSKSLGFIMGHRFSLERIKSEYPTLSLGAEMAEIEFNNTFGIAEKKY